jgi:hypothetical protein
MGLSSASPKKRRAWSKRDGGDRSVQEVRLGCDGDGGKLKGSLVRMARVDAIGMRGGACN